MEAVKVVTGSEIANVIESDHRLKKALTDFIAGHFTGVLEIHFNAGGIANVVGKPWFRYK